MFKRAVLSSHRLSPECKSKGASRRLTERNNAIKKSSCCCHHTSQSVSAGTHSNFMILSIFTLGQTLFTVPACADLNWIIPVCVPLIKTRGVKSCPGRNECYRNTGEMHSGKHDVAKTRCFLDKERTYKHSCEGASGMFLFIYWVTCWWRYCYQLVPGGFSMWRSGSSGFPPQTNNMPLRQVAL